jgi:hypothetical protein
VVVQRNGFVMRWVFFVMRALFFFILFSILFFSVVLCWFFCY